MKTRKNWLSVQKWFRKEHPQAPIEHFIDLQRVVKEYKTPAGSFCALKGIDLQINAGDFVAIVGKSGSGKSTLLNMVTGIDHPTTGEILIEGSAIHKYSEDKLTQWRGKNLGIVFQFFQLIPTLTVMENVIIPMDFTGKYSFSERYRRARQLLTRVEMLDFKDKLPANLSGGQQQRAAIARALANDPPIIVADEPTGNLDSATAEAIFRLFENLASQGKTVIIVTHDNELASRCKWYIRLADGLIVEKKYPIKDSVRSETLEAAQEAL